MSLEQWLRALRSRLSRQNSNRRSRQTPLLTPSLVAEVLENRELLSSVTGKVLNAADSDFSGTTNDVTANPTVVDTLNLKAVTGNLKVSLSKMAGAAKIRVFVERTVSSTTTNATYIIKEGNGGLPNLLAGNNDSQRVQINMNNIGIDKVDLSTIANLQLASGKTESAVLAKLTRPGSAAIIANNASVRNIVMGKSGSATDAMDAIFLTGSQIGTITKNTTFTGKLRLVFPDGPKDSTSPVRIDAATLATQPLPGGTKLSGFTSANLNYLETGDGDQILNIGNTPGLNALAGTGNDTLIAGTGNQRLEGGTGNDTYVIEGNFAVDTVVETSGGGTGDTISFNRPNPFAITADIYQNNPTTGPAGVNIVGTTSSWNKIENAKFIEKLVGGNQNNVYRFHDDWGYDALDTTTTFTIDDSASTSAKGTLDFSTVTHNMEFVLDENGVVTVTAKVVKGTGPTAKTHTYTVSATAIANIVGGKGTNTYVIRHGQSLKGRITTPTGGINNLDFSRFNDDVEFHIIVDNNVKAVTGLALATAPAKQFERQRIAISNASSGTFTLSAGGNTTNAIAWGATQVATMNNIQSAINAKFGAGFINVVNGGGNTWLLDFAIPANHPQFTIDSSSLRTAAGAALPAGSATLTTNRNGITPFGSSGIDRIDAISGGPRYEDFLLIDTITTTAGGRRTFVYAPAATSTTANGGQAGDVLTGSSAADTLSGGGGDDQIAGNGGNDQLRGDAGDDSIEGGLGDDTLSGGLGNDKLEGGPGSDQLIGGPGDDIYILKNGWGSDTVLEASTAGKDKLDFSQVTNPVSFVFSNGSLKAGTSTPTVTNKPSYFLNLSDINGTFTAGDQITVAKGGDANEIQAVSIGGAAAGSKFTLTLNDVTNNLNFSKEITVGADDAATAANIQTQLNAALGADAVNVIAASYSTFNIEFRKPAKTNIATMQLGTSNLTWPTLSTPHQSQAGGSGQNARWNINIGMASGGTFKLQFNNGTAKLTGAIVIDQDPEVTANNINTAMTAIGISTIVAIDGMGLYSIEFKNSAATNVTGLQFSTPSLTYPTAIAELQAGQLGSEIQRITLANVQSGTFVLKVGDRVTNPISWNAVPSVTAQNIATILNATRQDGTFSVRNFSVTVKGTGSASSQTFDITFNTPSEKDVADIVVDKTGLTATSGSVTDTVTTVQNGQAAGPNSVETVIAPNADTTMVFGDQILNSIWDVAKQALLPGDLRNYGELTIDSSVLTANSRNLTLDFSNVTRAMEFEFEDTGNTEVQKVNLSAATSLLPGSVFRLKIGSVTTGDIVTAPLESQTSTNIQNAIEKAFPGTIYANIPVSVSSGFLPSKTYEVTFRKNVDMPTIEVQNQTGTALTGATVAVLREGVTGTTTLTIEKVYQLPQFLETSYLGDIWKEYWGEIRYDKVVITNVDARTTIIGGLNENTFAIKGETTFAGTIVGQRGLRPLSSFLDYKSLTSAFKLDPPTINTINTLDMSDSSAKTPTLVNLTHIVNGGAVNTQTVTDAQSGRELQRIVFPKVNTGTFKLKGKTASATSFTTTTITLTADAAANATAIQNALNTSLGETANQGVRVTSVQVTDATGAKLQAFNVEFQREGIDYDSITVENVTLAESVSLSADNVKATGTPNASVTAIDLSAHTAVSSVKLKVELSEGVFVTTAATGKTAAEIEQALNTILTIQGQASVLGAAKVTLTAANKFDIEFPRGTVGISVLNAANDSVLTAGTITKFSQSKNLIQKLTFGGATAGLVDVRYTIKHPSYATHTIGVTIDVASATAAQDLEDGMNEILNLGAGAVSVTGDIASGLIVTFNVDANGLVKANGTVLPLILNASTLTKPATVTEVPVGPVGVVVESVIHEVQRIVVGSGTMSGTFKLTVTDPVSGLTKTTADIAVGTNKSDTADNIQAAINAVGVLGSNATYVTVNHLGGWEIEFLLPGNIADTTINTQPTGVTLSVSTLRDGSVNNNSVQKFRLNEADSGSFTLSFGETTTSPIQLQDGTATPVGTIDAFAVAARIKTALENLKNVTLVNVKAYEVAGITRTLISAAGQKDANKVEFEVEFVAPDSTLGVEKLKVDAAGLTKRLSAASTADAVTVTNGQWAVSEIQKLSRVDIAKAGTSFKLAWNGSTTEGVAYTTAGIQQAYDEFAHQLDAAQVTGVNTDNWFVTFTNERGKDVSLTGMVTANASQIAQDVGFGDLLTGLRRNVPGAKGFTGVVQNMSNVIYGAGFNIILGTNVDIYKSLLSSNSDASSALDLIRKGGFTLGKNVISVGGNILSNLFEDGRDANGNLTDSVKNFAKKFITDTLTGSLVDGELAIGEPTLAPGIHLLSGMTGGDVYKFEGLWGAAAVIEPPSVNVAGLDLNLGYDTLDFSGVSSDLIFDVYTLTTDNIEGWQKEVTSLGHPTPLSIGMNLVLVRNNAGTKALEGFAKIAGGAIDAKGFGLNYVLATGIENIISGKGDNTIIFHGNARLEGYVSPGPDGKIKFDYSDYTPTSSTTIGSESFNGVVVDGGAGLSYGLVGNPAPLPVIGTFPGINVNWGSASGVLGSRIVGLDLWFPTATLGQLAPANNAVDGLKSVVGSPLRDSLTGNFKDNTFEVGQGGSDRIDGSTGKDTVDFRAANTDMLVDLKTGKAHSALSAGTAVWNDTARTLTLMRALVFTL